MFLWSFESDYSRLHVLLVLVRSRPWPGLCFFCLGKDDSAIYTLFLRAIISFDWDVIGVFERSARSWWIAYFNIVYGEKLCPINYLEIIIGVFERSARLWKIPVLVCSVRIMRQMSLFCKAYTFIIIHSLQAHAKRHL